MSAFDIISLMLASIAFWHGLNEISEKKYFILRMMAKSWPQMFIAGLLGKVVIQLSTIIQLM